MDPVTYKTFEDDGYHDAIQDVACDKWKYMKIREFSPYVEV
jgi:hypothetical protein